MSITSIALSFMVGLITGILGARAGVPAHINAVVGACAGIAVMQLCYFFGLP
jgi:hypothetical protein